MDVEADSGVACAVVAGGSYVATYCDTLCAGNAGSAACAEGELMPPYFGDVSDVALVGADAAVALSTGLRVVTKEYTDPSCSSGVLYGPVTYDGPPLECGRKSVAGCHNESIFICADDSCDGWVRMLNVQSLGMCVILSIR